MKKSVKILLLVTALAVAMCVSVLATDNPVGVYNVAPETDFTTTVNVVPKTADGTAIDAVEATVDENTVTFYEDAEKFDVAYGAASEGKYYLVLILNDEGAPREDSIVYIDQVTAEGTDVAFATYPSALAAGSYYVYISSNDGMGYKKVASFTYGEAVTTPPYTLGDVNEDGNINTVDALRVLRIFSGAIDINTLSEGVKLAADVTKDGNINTVDALRILRYFSGAIESF